MKKTRYTGVFTYTADDGETSYYIRYKITGKSYFEKVGVKSQGITPKAAKVIRDKAIAEARYGSPKTDEWSDLAVSFEQASNEYLNNCESRSIKKFLSLYRMHLAHMGSMSVSAIDSSEITKLKKRKSEEKSKQTGRVLAPKTVNNILALLSAILNSCVDNGYIQSAPKIKKYSVSNTRERFLNTDEIDALLVAIKASNLRTKERLLLFTKVALTTGGRVGTILGIQGKNIDRVQRTIHLHNFKTGRDYTAFIPQSLLVEIPDISPQNYLIDVSDAKQIQRPLQGILDTLFNQGLDTEDRKQRVVLHTLRHTFASQLAINDVPIHKIMKLMDHQDIKMTLRYAKLMPDSGRDEVESLYSF